MGLRNTTPVKFSPVSVCDALDPTDLGPGAMQSLANLIPDPSTKNLFQCRPAAVSLTTFAGFAAAGFISCGKVIGTRIYGMIATSRNANHDEPFCYDTQTSLFVTIGGTIDSTTTPTSPSTVGAWTPPSMDLIGTKLVVCHPGFSGTGGVYIGWFDLTNPASPTWNGGNLGGLISFTTAPSVVANFNGRAYYIVNPTTGQPSLIYSDILDAVTCTNANQVLTFDDNVPLTALGPLGLNTPVTGGILQALMVFKGVQAIYQITGDAASTSNPLTKNALNIPTGTLAPLSVCQTPKGLAFVSPDGLRIIDFQSNISDPIGVAGAGISLPYIYAVTPSRIVAACNGNVLRITAQNGAALGNPNQEYWLDFARQCWTGPHTCAASLIFPFSNKFIMAPVGSTAALYTSDVVQTLTSTYTEFGAALSFTWQTSMLPDTDQMCENNMLETTLYMALVSGGAAITCKAIDQDSNTLNSVTVSVTGTQTLWGQFQWGQALWSGGTSALFPRQLAWTIPVVFRRVSIQATGTSAQGIKIGRLHLRYEMLGYLQMVS